MNYFFICFYFWVRLMTNKDPEDNKWLHSTFFLMLNKEKPR